MNACNGGRAGTRWTTRNRIEACGNFALYDVHAGREHEHVETCHLCAGCMDKALATLAVGFLRCSWCDHFCRLLVRHQPIEERGNGGGLDFPQFHRSGQ